MSSTSLKINISKYLFNIFLVFYFSLLYLLQYYYILSFFGIIIFILTFFIFYILKRYHHSLCLLLLFSPIVNFGVNIYTFKILNVNVFYILLILLFLKNIALIKKINSKYIFIITLLLLFLIYSLKNILEFKEFFQDTILLFSPFMLYICFRKKFSNNDLIYIFIILSYVKLLTTFLMYYFSITLSNDTNMFNRLVVDNSDEIGLLLKTLILSIFLFTNNIKFRILSFILISLNILGTYQYGPQFIGLGSLSILFITFVIIIFIINKVLTHNYKFILTSLLLLIPFLIKPSNESINYKMNNILELSHFLFSNYTIYALPNSAQIRVIEILNIINEPTNLIVGTGLGGYFVDDKYPFPPWTNKFDFSEKELYTGKFFKPHNINYNLLKYGILFISVLFYLFLYRNSFKNLSHKILYLNLLLFIGFNFGAGIKAALCLGILFIVLSNKNSNEIFILKNSCV
jgi:hypothetical protein